MMLRMSQMAREYQKNLAAEVMNWIMTAAHMASDGLHAHQTFTEVVKSRALRCPGYNPQAGQGPHNRKSS